MATEARAVERRMVEEMGGDKWGVVGAGIPHNAVSDRGTRATGTANPRVGGSTPSLATT